MERTPSESGHTRAADSRSLFGMYRFLSHLAVIAD